MTLYQYNLLLRTLTHIARGELKYVASALGKLLSGVTELCLVSIGVSKQLSASPTGNNINFGCSYLGITLIHLMP